MIIQLWKYYACKHDIRSKNVFKLVEQYIDQLFRIMKMEISMCTIQIVKEEYFGIDR